MYKIENLVDSSSDSSMNEIDELTISSYPKYKTVMGPKLKTLTRKLLAFIHNSILKESPNSLLTKEEYVDRIQQISFSIITGRKQDSKRFWFFIAYFDPLFKIIKRNRQKKSKTFKTISKNLIEIYEEPYLKRPKLDFQSIQMGITLDKDNMCVCSEDTEVSEMHRCVRCNKHFHEDCFKWNTTKPICPFCLILTYDHFKEPLKTVVPIHTLKTKEEFNFFVDPKFFDKTNKLVFRCMRIYGFNHSTYNDHRMNYPQKLTIRLNTKKIVSTQPDEPTNLLRLDSPYEMCIRSDLKTALLKGLNHMTLEYDESYEREDNIVYLFGIFVCYDLEEDGLLSKIKNRSHRPYYLMGKQFIKAFFDYQGNCEEVVLNTSDPITGMNIVIPARGSLCDHLNVFCLESFIKTYCNTDYRRITCPFCKRLIIDFVIDKYFFKLLNNFYCAYDKIMSEDKLVIYRDLTVSYILYNRDIDDGETENDASSLSSFENSGEKEAEVVNLEDTIIEVKTRLSFRQESCFKGNKNGIPIIELDDGSDSYKKLNIDAMRQCEILEDNNTKKSLKRVKLR